MCNNNIRVNTNFLTMCPVGIKCICWLSVVGQHVGPFGLWDLQPLGLMFCSWLLYGFCGDITIFWLYLFCYSGSRSSCLVGMCNTYLQLDLSPMVACQVACWRNRKLGDILVQVKNILLILIIVMDIDWLL